LTMAMAGERVGAIRGILQGRRPMVGGDSEERARIEVECKHFILLFWATRLFGVVAFFALVLESRLCMN
jgi:hypothetical protein